MKPITFLLILLLNPQAKLWSQDNLWNSRQNIILEFESYADTNFEYVMSEKENSISVGIYGIDSLTIDYFFRPYTNGKFDEESTCDSIVIKLLCENCVEFHVAKMIRNNDRKWIKLSDSLYLSSNWVSKFWPADKSPNIYTVPLLKIIEDDQVTQMILYTEKFTKNQWKELRNKPLTKNN